MAGVLTRLWLIEAERLQREEAEKSLPSKAEQKPAPKEVR